MVLVLSWLVAGWSVIGAARLFRRRLSNDLLRHVASKAVAIPVFLLGLYLVLQVSGLTRLAVTVLGGTGLVGLVIGFAFRDIAENFLASILISLQHPFAKGDLIEVTGSTGYVRQVNTRSTLLMTLDGNHVQIPNATVYKETIVNFTANPNMRLHFTVGIGYENSIGEAQTIAMAVLRDHPAVLGDPESLVLVDSLGAATVNLSPFFWVDTSKHSQFKVRSAVIRLIKQAFEQAGISMPDEAREVVFPDGVPVHMSKAEEVLRRPPPTRGEQEGEEEAHSAEGELASEASEICEQADRSRMPEGGQDLL
jgi:small-conductance mechanosensitive channel